MACGGLEQVEGLAFEQAGAGVPVVLLHGLTFDRTTWRPIVERLGGAVHTVAFDLPGHGDSGGAPCELQELADRLAMALAHLDIERPVMVGHSISGSVAGIFGASHPVRGVVVVDQSLYLRPFAELVRRLEPGLRENFAPTFEAFQQSMRLELLPEPTRSQVLALQDVRRDLVLGYWRQVLRSDPEELQRSVESQISQLRAPLLCVYGRDLDAGERDYLRRLCPSAQIEEWPGSGHMVHLVHPDRFAERLDAFVRECAAREDASPAA
jgi:pimeloyl-ACP methyl ester carboxylesterase